ncbi:MAG: asparaginase [Alphaproteobacteria bacterium]
MADHHMHAHDHDHDGCGHDHGPAANPVCVEVTRGGTVESVHRGSAAAVDAEGGAMLAWGDVETPVYPRSAVKPLQALPFVESGAADSCTDAEIALACASHSGTPAHVAAVTAWLARLGLGPDALECGPRWPLDEADMRALARAGGDASVLHNNCSGKHAAMLATALARGEPAGGYIGAAHPVQQRVRGVLEQVCGRVLRDAPTGIDGCGIPVIGIPLGHLAFGFARLVAPDELPPERARAARRIVAAMQAHPEMVAGPGRYDTEVMRAAGGRVIVKGGAEGVFCAALPEFGIGIALKCDDGSKRGAEAMLTAILAQLGALDAGIAAAVAGRLSVPVESAAGAAVGEIRPAAWLTDPQA